MIGRLTAVRRPIEPISRKEQVRSKVLEQWFESREEAEECVRDYKAKEFVCVFVTEDEKLTSGVLFKEKDARKVFYRLEASGICLAHTDFTLRASV